jgi:CHAT domain-containing protein
MKDRLGRFKRLPGCAGEARVVASIVSNATLFTSPDATTAAVRAIRRPSFLHFATHGFVLEAQLEADRSLNDDTLDAIDGEWLDDGRRQRSTR